MRCRRLPAHGTLKITMALADPRWNPAPKPSINPADSAREKDYVMRVKFDDFSSYWLGHADGNVYAPRPTLEWLKVDGEYTASYRKRFISQKVNVGGKISIKQSLVPPN